jgi:hypothetical protein
MRFVVSVLSVIILLPLGVLIPIHPPPKEATLLDTHVIAKPTMKNTRQKAAILFNLEIAKLIISNSRHVMKSLFFSFIRDKNAVTPTAE